MADLHIPLHTLLPGYTGSGVLVLHDDGAGTFAPAVYQAGTTGGGAVTLADGADGALGATTDAAVVNPALAATLIALSKGQLTELLALAGLLAHSQAPMAGSVPVAIASDQTAVPVTAALQTSHSATVCTTKTDATATTGVSVAGYNGAQMLEAVAVGTVAAQAATFTIQGSYDNANWYSAGYQQVDGAAAPPRAIAAVTLTPGNGTERHVYQVLDAYAYLRLNVTANTLVTGLTATLFMEPN